MSHPTPEGVRTKSGGWGTKEVEAAENHVLWKGEQLDLSRTPPWGSKTETIHNTVADTTSQVSLGSTRAQTIDVFPPQHSGLPGRAGVQGYTRRPHPHTHPFVHALTDSHTLEAHLEYSRKGDDRHCLCLESKTQATGRERG